MIVAFARIGQYIHQVAVFDVFRNRYRCVEEEQAQL